MVVPSLILNIISYIVKIFLFIQNKIKKATN